MSRGLCKVRVVEGWVGEELSFASQKTRRVASRCGFHAHARRGVGAEVGVLDGAEGVGVFLAEVGLDGAQGEVHNGEAAGGGVALFRLLPPQPNHAGSLCETKWALPPRRFVLALKLHTARRDSAIPYCKAHTAERSERGQTAVGARGGGVVATVVFLFAHDLW